jgi:arylsulfatase A-like enzyme
MSRATRLTVGAAAALLALTSSPALGQNASPAPLPATEPAPDGAGGLPPDIIVVMIDDLGYVPNDRVLKRLPTISSTFLDGGLRFRGMHTETPLCGPSRATLLTGQHTLQHGAITNGDPMDPARTVATAMDDAGYHTMLVGKYLNRYEGTRTPPGWDQVFMRESPIIPAYSENGELRRFPGQHFDNVVRKQAVEWLAEAPSDEPVFALITPRAPHRHPQQCRQGRKDPVGCDYLPQTMKRDRKSEECDGLKPYKAPDYATPASTRPAPWSMPDWPRGWPLEASCESLLVIDRMVEGLQAVQAERDRPAYYVFMSDNGMAWGREGYPGKHVPPSTRLPFYVAGPDIEPGATDALVSNIDIVPTLTELAGAAAPADAGTSFAPALRGEDFGGRDELLEVMPKDPQAIYAGWAGLRTPEWHYVRWDDGRTELYDLRKDPWEQKNLARKRKGRVQRMDARLDELLEASRRAPFAEAAAQA